MSVTDLIIKKRRISGKNWAEVTAHSSRETTACMIPWAVYTNIVYLVLLHARSDATEKEILKVMSVK